jgi:hypothetical protein
MRSIRSKCYRIWIDFFATPLFVILFMIPSKIYLNCIYNSITDLVSAILIELLYIVIYVIRWRMLYKNKFFGYPIFTLSIR